MNTAMHAGLGVLLLLLGLAGCGRLPVTAPAATAQQECEQSGGVWRGAHCERSSGGGY